MNTQTAIKHTVELNGLDMDRLYQTLDAIKTDPSLARFEFRARNNWINGGENRSSIKDFYGVHREDDSRREPFVFTNDEPPVLLGENKGANPVEVLLHALAGCVTTTTVLHAAARGIRITELSTELRGEMDLQGLLALDDAVSPGYEQIRIRMHIKADCSEEELDELLDVARGHSPVCTTVCRPVPVVLERVKEDNTP
ncbi:MAG TPA: OsmC family protein [Gammaproteobacteria bacterium]|nr:OsmC family protein [Gammaproteobacteria bacterium]